MLTGGTSLALLLVLSGCSGSKLGDTLGQRLEPDPQLAENATDAEVATGEDAAKPAAQGDDKPAANGPGQAGQAADSKPADSSDDEKKKPASSQTAQTPAEPEAPKVVGGDYTDLAKAPEEIQPYLVDLLELKLLEIRPPVAKPTPAPTPAATGDADGDTEENAAPAPKPTPAPAPPNADEFRPNQAVTRREYARWLLATNNRFYSGQRTRKIRPGVSSSQPVFQDVKANDPDFDAIQGLAEAGIIPSPLTGSSTTLTFRPDAPLTRKDLLLWKVPLDTRQPLPQATSAAVQEAWGFQDASKIEPRALQAVLADHQNGDFANIRRAFSYTTLFQPDKAATRAEAGAVLWRFGNSTEGLTAQELRSPQATDTDEAPEAAVGG
ncbi:MAG: S-layer homology domain-containing protein [Cyanobacteria bacterium J06598_3]